MPHSKPPCTAAGSSPSQNPVAGRAVATPSRRGAEGVNVPLAARFASLHPTHDSSATAATASAAVRTIDRLMAEAYGRLSRTRGNALLQRVAIASRSSLLAEDRREERFG